MDLSTPPLYRPPRHEQDDSDDERGFELRYSRTRLWTDLETNFHSASFANLRWKPRPKTFGWGPELAYYFTPNDKTIGLRIGAFHGTAVTNSHREGGLYVRETTRTRAYWADAEFRHVFTRWSFVTVGLGGFLYHLKTDLDTNAPSFVYDTATVTGAFGAIGVGAGLETPWDYPLRLFAATNFWLPFAREDASFEWGLGQVSGGVAWRF